MIDDYDDMSQIELNVLIAAHRANEGRLNSRSQKEKIIHSVPKQYKGTKKGKRNVEKALNQLIKWGLIKEQPSGNPTFSITKYGISIVKAYEESLNKEE
ncbi:MAG: hypothetical protein ACXAD7_16940 [Candidatus Kariarchaeaceae archaeon]|jgi:predicted transcriptional regulator